jgi:hypothetical protein
MRKVTVHVMLVLIAVFAPIPAHSSCYFSENFSSGSIDSSVWSFYRYENPDYPRYGSVPDPTVENGRAFITTPNARATLLTTGERNWSDYSVSANVKIEKSLDDAGRVITLYFFMRDIEQTDDNHRFSANSYYFTVRARDRTWRLGGLGTTLKSGTVSITTGKEYIMKVDATGDAVDLYFYPANTDPSSVSPLATVQLLDDGLCSGGIGFGGADDVISIDDISVCGGSASPRYYGNFAITGGTYSENDNLHQAVSSELGTDYQVADWNDIVAYYNSGGSASAFESALAQTAMLSRNGDQWYSSSRHYLYQISHRPGQTPFDNFLSHANVGNHAFDLGSWYGLDMPILAVKQQSSGNTGGTTRLTGNVRYNGSPMCAMVLANGKYMFTCSGDGSFDLNVPLDGNGQITVYSFCSGLAPFKQVIYPYQSQGLNIDLGASGNGTEMDVDFSWTDIGGGKIRLDGTIRYNGRPVCAMVLANGQYAFTCSGDGSFRLDVPLDGNGEITVYGFCSGLPPYKYVLAPTLNGGNEDLSMVDLVGNWHISIDVSGVDTSNYYISVTLYSNGTFSYTEYYYGNVYDSGMGTWSYNTTSRDFIANSEYASMCAGTLPGSATENTFSVPGQWYQYSATYHWSRQ